MAEGRSNPTPLIGYRIPRLERDEAISFLITVFHRSKNQGAKAASVRCRPSQSWFPMTHEQNEE